MSTSQSNIPLLPIVKLVILFYVSFRLFSLAPFNQIPYDHYRPRDVGEDSNPDVMEEVVHTAPTHAHTSARPKPSRSTPMNMESDEPAPKVSPSSRKSRNGHESAGSLHPPSKNFGQQYSVNDRIMELMKEADLMMRSADSEQKSKKLVSIYEEILELDPRNTQAHLQLGFNLITDIANPARQRRGFTLLERSLDGKYVNEPIPLKSPQAFVLSQTIGRYRIEQKEHKISQYYLNIAKEAMPGDTCTEVMSASMIDPYPDSIESQNKSMELYLKRMDALIRRAENNGGHLPLDPRWIQVIPGAVSDTYVHCLSTLFHHSFYYNADIVAGTSKHYQVATKVWPELNYISPKLLAQDGKTFKKPKKQCSQRKIRLGIISGHFTEGSSVVEDFKGVIKNLSRDIFDIHHIYIMEKPFPPSKVMLDPRDSLTVVKKEMDDSRGTNKWIDKPRKDIEALNLDVLLYLDLTMSMNAHRLGMSRLAPVQAVSHGHPMTSGFPRSVMDYYISWAGAELPLELAQKHYTEELKLLPADTLHQYYEERSSKGRSLIDFEYYDYLVQQGRTSFPNVPSDGNWYLIMQKPFKLMPEFDYFVAGILSKDPDGRVIMHEEDSEVNQLVFIERLKNAGSDMQRVHFMPVLPHFKLMALYILSDVILDSYPAGGCTTTREVLEAGKVLVTFPSKYLGSRWTLGYLNILGDERLKDLLVANSVDEYTTLATNLGMNESLRSEAEARIKKNIHKLYRSDDAVDQWTKILLDISPVRRCSSSYEL